MKCSKKKNMIIIVVLLIISIICIGVLVIKKNGANTKSLLIVGDSIGEGAGCSDPALKWYKMLIPYMKEKYGINLEITNVSMGGNTSYAGYVRTMNLDERDSYNYIIVCYGQNDAIEDFSLYYETLLRTLKGKHPSAVMISILESSQRVYTEKMQIIQELCEYYGIYVADTIAAFNTSGRAYEELCDDGTHPNDEGYKLYFNTVAKIMDQCYQETANTTLETLEAINEDVEQFETYLYYSKDDFKKIDDFNYVLEIGNISGRLGIDYTTLKGDNWIRVYTENPNASEKRLVWNNEFSLRYIEVIANEFLAGEKIKIEFSSEKMAENFRGIIVTARTETYSGL